MTANYNSGARVQAASQLTNQVISKVHVFPKAVSKSGRKKASSFKIFLLRNIEYHHVFTAEGSN
jgi:hypothetical protein